MYTRLDPAVREITQSRELAERAIYYMQRTPDLLDMQIERLPNPKGDRVKITMSGKFLPYKYYGASANVPTYGYKEE